MKNYFSNGWNWVHFCSGIIGFWGLLLVAHKSVTDGVCFPIWINIIKETLDALSRGTRFEGKFGLDPNGADLRDIIMCALGVALAWGLVAIF